MAYETLRFVDQVGKNYLIRGGSPVSDGGFDYDGLMDVILKLPQFPKGLKSSDFYLVDINLQHANETDSLIAEISFLKWNNQTPNPFGQLVLWDTLGTPKCYWQTEPWERARLVATLDEWLPDPLNWRVVTLRSWLENPGMLPLQPLPDPNKPIIVYVHCSGGCDRTSEMIGAYRLRYMPAAWTMGDAWISMYDEHPCTLPMGCNNYMATQWYAFWLNETRGYSIGGIGIDGGCNNAGTLDRLCFPDMPR
ncbi:MAG TPA: hypothetical protein VH206_18275 [Xanthobacteraceae bacterium]|jgi:hypothetical protein|nr:hypothetical protein [Xanthobacteraceae bacterium]